MGGGQTARPPSSAACQRATAPGLTFTLAVPEGREAQVLAEAGRIPSLPVRVVPVPGIEKALLVRPDSYVAGRAAAGDGRRLLSMLAHALGTASQRPSDAALSSPPPRSTPKRAAAQSKVEGTR